MLIIHANDPTTSFLSALYAERNDICGRIDEHNTNGEVIHAMKGADRIMMLGHGCKDGLFGLADKNGMYRPLVYNRHVEFLRRKECIGIWCHADEFATRYHLDGLFSGMIISELSEAKDCEIETTAEEVERENKKFAERLRDCINSYPLPQVPAKMAELDDVHSPLTEFNYSRLYYFKY
ncbi:MAG: hypothetical protein IKP43_03280 [Bacteroidaceae bacterium]|jgi:hypothetical protein|nr:hypothetical protein [Bacteroidaceae bacterium]